MKIIHNKLEKYLPEFVYGSIDGTITTFAIVAGIAGASLSPVIALILGVSNVLADGFSMASSNYLSEKSKRKEKTDSNNEFINVEMKTAFATFISFVAVGFIPILPFLFNENFYMKMFGFYKPFLFSTILTLLTFIFIGYIRGLVNKENKIRTSIETLSVGSLAAFISYIVGYYLHFLVN